MKNLKIITTVTSFAFVLMNFSPMVADAKEFPLKSEISGNVSIGVSERMEESDDNNNKQDNRDNNDRNDDRVKAYSNATVTASSGVVLPRGIEKRLEDGKGLPNGWTNWFNKRFKKHSTSTVDTTLPVIKDINVVSIGTSTATVNWKTKESTTGQVRFATSSTVDVNSSLVVDSSTSTNHSVSLAGLSANTQYYYTITVKDSAGNTKVSGVQKFRTKTLVSVDVTAPSIYFSTTYNTNASSTHILWLTNERSDSKIWVSTTSPVNIAGSSTVNFSDKVFLHDVTVSGLASSTVYFYGVESADVAGNKSVVVNGSFTTGM